MKKFAMCLLGAVALLSFFCSCSFETDGKFAGLIAGINGGDYLRPPSNVTASADASGGIHISWTGDDNADGYTIYRSSAADSARFVRRGSSGKNEYTDSGVSVPPDTPFYYQVTAYNSKGTSEASAVAGPVSASRNVAILDEPEITGAVGVSGDITITWNNVPGATGYILYRSSMYDDDIYIIRIDTPSLFYEDKNLTPGWFSYQIRAYNDEGEGYLSLPYGPVDSNAPGDPQPVPEMPKNLYAAEEFGYEPSRILISWNAVANADKYCVYRSTEDDLYEEIGQTASTSYLDISGSGNVLQKGAAYFYRVRGYSGTQSGYLSGPCGPVLLLPEKPVLSATVSGSTVTLNWAAVYGADAYHVYRSSDNVQFILLSGQKLNDTSWTDSALAAGDWYYRVEASNSAGKGPASETKKVEVILDQWPGITVPDGGSIIPIKTQADLESIRDQIDDPAFNYGKNAYVMTQDIDLIGTWTPIGYVETVNTNGVPTGGIHPFNGNFYGNGYTIRNLVLPGGSIHFIGLFGFIDEALIQDLQVELGETVISVSNNSTQNVGIIAGSTTGSVIKNCGAYSQTGIIINGSSGRAVQFGGISGYGDGDAIIENCYASMNITVTYGGTHNIISGIAGWSESVIRNCYYAGNIIANGLYADVHGIGSGQPAIIEKSYSTGTITNNATGFGYTTASGIGQIGSISNNVAMMEQIAITNFAGFAKRIQCQSGSDPVSLTNNYAFAGVLLNGATVSSNDPNSQNGLDKTVGQLKQQTTYENSLGWDFDDVWEMGPPSYPFPVLKWQEGVVKLPDGFSVIEDDFTFAVPLTSTNNIAPYLNSQSEGATDDDPAALPLSLELTEANWLAILAAIEDAGKFVNLDLSACTRSGSGSGGGLRSDGAFDPIRSVEDGKSKIVCIALPDTAKSIVDGTWTNRTFDHFTALNSFSGVGLTSIGNYAFLGCTSLTLTELPANLTHIGSFAFMDCTNLTLTELPAGLVSIGDYAFAYAYTSLTLTELPAGLSSIGSLAFIGCMSLELTELPAGLATIGSRAFQGCTGLGSLIIPASVIIDENPFVDCSSLNSFVLTGSGTLGIIEDGKALVRNNVELIAYPAATGNITLPAGLASIGNYAFSGCSNLAQITLPAGLSSIGRLAFNECKNLTQITLPAELTSIGDAAFQYCSILDVIICHTAEPPELGNYVFLVTPSGMQIKVPSGSVDDYKTAPGWSDYADRISAIEIIQNASSPGDFTAALSTIQSDSVNDNFVITVTADFNLNPQDLTLSGYKNKAITIRGNNPARTIGLSTQGSLFTVGEDVELVLENIVLEGISDNDASLVTVDGGKLVLNSGGKVTGNTYTVLESVNAGGVNIKNSAQLIMNDGEISGNTASFEYDISNSSGVGGLCVQYSTFIMNGGKISNNTATFNYAATMAAGVIIRENSTFNMYDGEISDNNVTYSHFNTFNAGGILVDGGSVFTMYNGKITRNTSSGPGSSGGEAGGVIVKWGGEDLDGGTFYMHGGEISANKSTSHTISAGGIFIQIADEKESFFIKYGGIVYGSDAADVSLRNTNANGAVIYSAAAFGENSKFRNTTLGEDDGFDSSLPGSDGGWE